MTARRQFPATLTVGLVGSAALSFAFWIGLLHAISAEGLAYAQIDLMAWAIWLARIVVVTAGVIGLREVATRRRLVTAATVLILVWSAVELVLLADDVWFTFDRGGGARHLEQLDPVIDWGLPVVALGLRCAIAGLGVRRDRVDLIAIVVAVGVASIFLTPFPPMADLVPRPGTVRVLWQLGLQAIIIGGMIGGGRLGTAAVGVGWAPAQRGLEPAASAMAARIAFAVAVVPLAVLAFAMRSEGLFRFVIIGAPTGAAVVGMVAASALFAASRADTEGAPRHRLAAAGWLISVGACADALAALATWRYFGAEDADLAAGAVLGPAWMLAVLELAAIYAFLSALGAIAARVQTGVQSEGLAVAGVAMTAVAGGGVWLQRSLRHDPSGPVLVLVSLAISVVAIIAMVRIVTLSRQVAAALGGMPSVPTAVARDRADG